MLQAIRDKTRGWIAYVIVAVLVVPFATFGLYNYLTGGGNPAVAEVNGTEIKTNELTAAVQRQQAQLRRMLGDRYDAEAFDDATLRRQALDQLITQALLRDFIDSHGLAGTDGMVASQLRQTPAFQQNGEFSPEQYRRVLRQNSIRVDEYEGRVRRQAALDQLRQAVTDSAFVTDAEIARVAAVQYQERDVAWLRVDASALRDQVTLDDAAVREYYEAHQDAYRRPRQVRLAYLMLSPETVAEDVSISESELRARYEEVKDSRTEPERRATDHILIQVPDDADDEAVAAARERLVAIRERIVDGELSFAEAAREYSDDPGSAADGGSLGMVQRGDMVERFEEAAFALEAGEISDPVRTAFGWHLVRVNEIAGGETPSFEALRDEIRQQMAREIANKQLFEKANELGNLAYESRDSLEPAAEALGLTVQETDWFGEDGASSGLAANDKVVEAAFSPELLTEGRNSDVITLDDDRRVVVRVREQRPATVLPLEQVRDRVEKQLAGERAAELAREKGESLVSELERDPAAAGRLAEAYAVSFNEAGWIGRRAEGVPSALVEAVFAMPAPGGEAPGSVSGLQIDNGDYAAILLRGVRDGDVADLSEQERRDLARLLRETDANSSERDLIASLREDADITIYEDRL